MCKCRNIIICVLNVIYMYISISTVRGTFMGACTMYVYVYTCTQANDCTCITYMYIIMYI